MATPEVPGDLILPEPKTPQEEELYRTLQNWTNTVRQSFSAVGTTAAGTFTDLTATSTVNFSSATVGDSTIYKFVPQGVILMWSGSIATIPSGWAICDGNNGTPDLTDRFVLHADGVTNTVGASGGAKTVDLEHNHNGTSGSTTLTAAQSGLPAHTHTVSITDGGGGTERIQRSNGESNVGTHTSSSTGGTSASSGHTHTISNAGSTTQTIRDKYYALAYIMKT